eukprot:CAMPEP_0194377898 /NCGR_PEP_ID=MMETSP0174-20130528/32934_1 /TAXON_ID=216777 /ORGANISM="Proboscia alata, Strain PI-D3" /LENGTH=616 /DNA_ID=CAMNT_0039159551 /DNA_START=143 /DNA_END=1993 /DNA_ORIENTATION=+
MADMGGTEVIIGGAIITAIVAVVAYSLMGNGSSSEVQKKVTSGSQSNGSANKTEGSNKDSRKKAKKREYKAKKAREVKEAERKLKEEEEAIEREIKAKEEAEKARLAAVKATEELDRQRKLKEEAEKVRIDAEEKQLKLDEDAATAALLKNGGKKKKKKKKKAKKAASPEEDEDIDVPVLSSQSPVDADAALAAAMALEPDFLPDDFASAQSDEWATVTKKTSKKKYDIDPVKKDGSVIINIGENYGALIGKAGSVIKKIGEDSGAKLDVNKAHCVVIITGTDEQIDLAVAEVRPILEREEALKANFKTITLAPGSDKVKAVIGSKGVTIKGIQQETSAKIDANVDEGNVTISGQSEQVDKALVLVNNAMYGEDQFQMIIPSKGALSFILGTDFQTIRRLQDETGAKLDIDKTKLNLAISGSKDGVIKAKIAVNDILLSLKTVTIVIESGKVGAVYGKGGSVIKSIQGSTGTNIDIERSLDNAVCTIVGATSESIQSASILVEKAIRGETEVKAGEVKESIDFGSSTAAIIPAIIGKKGQTVRELEGAHGVRIEVGKETLTCNIVGKKDAVNKARAAIEKIAKPILEKEKQMAAVLEKGKETAHLWQELEEEATGW